MNSGLYPIDVIFAPSFGKPSDCIANQKIAKLAIKNSKNGTIIVADACVKIEGKNFFQVGDNDEKSHVATITLVEEFINFCYLTGKKRALIVTEDTYAERVLRDIRKMRPNRDLEVQALRTNEIDFFYLDSIQLWTQYKNVFKIREWILLNLMPFRFYAWFTKRFA